MPTLTDLDVHPARPTDTLTIAAVLASAFDDEPTTRWIDPDPVTRIARTVGYFTILTAAVMKHGSVDVATWGTTIVGVALWPTYPPAGGDALAALADQAATDPAVERLLWLEEQLAKVHPIARHAFLQYAGVRPDRQGLGIGTALLQRRHVLLDDAGLPAYLEATSKRSRDLYTQVGYADHGAPIVLPTGEPIQPMWRPANPA